MTPSKGKEVNIWRSTINAESSFEDCLIFLSVKYIKLKSPSLISSAFRVNSSSGEVIMDYV
jgi:hypothetical protein